MQILTAPPQRKAIIPRGVADRLIPTPAPPGTTVLSGFPSSSAKLSAAQRAQLSRLASIIMDRVLPKLHPTCHRLEIRVEGHEDETGDPARFHRLGLARATAAAKHLVGRMRRTRTYVRWIQRTLNRVNRAGLRVDGKIGSRTRAAIRNFQRRRGLAVDGIVGPKTEAALVAVGGPPSANWPPRVRVTSAGPRRPIRSNSTAAGRRANRRVEVRIVVKQLCRRA